MRTVAHASLIAVAAAAAAASTLVARPARACGGCFSPPREVTVVNDHRMAFSISQQQTVLWDQIEYSGAPQDFAWVLPVRGEARVELSHDEFFAALDAVTTPTITGPSPNCGGGGGGFGCGASSNSAGFAANAGAGGVQVLSQGTVGPYDTVTVHSADPNALYAWLVANGYDIPDSVRPIIDGYVAEGFDFLALRLAPGQGVQAMQPVRVVTPGAGLTLPLRMVAAGVGAQVGITLYVIGEGRYEAQNFPNALFDDSKLVWLHTQNRSNYEELSEQLMQGGGGRTWLTEFAGPISFVGSPSDSYGGYACNGAGPGGGVSYYGSGGYSLAGPYFAQCECAGQTTCTQSLGDASLDALLDGAGDEGGAGTDAGPGTDAGALTDAGAGADSGAGEGVDAGASDDAGAADDGSTGPDGGLTPPDGSCGGSACAGYDDLDVAMVGMDPSSMWVTRMRAILPSSALSEGDLVLQASASQTPVSNQHSATVYDDPTYNTCGGNSGSGCSAAAEDPGALSRWLVVGSFGVVLGALGRRRRLRRR